MKFRFITRSLHFEDYSCRSRMIVSYKVDVVGLMRTLSLPPYFYYSEHY